MSVLLDSYRFVAPAFNPLSISGCQLWLDASDADTITESSGAVSQWDDKSGNGRNATQSTSANRPTTGSTTINSLNTLSFDGSNDTMVFASNFMSGKSAGTVLAVWATASATDIGSPIVFGDDYANFGGSMYETFGTTSRRNFAHGITITNPHQFTIVSGSNDHRAYINGTQKFSSTSVVVGWGTQFFLANDPAAGGRWGGRLAEVLIYDSKLSTTDREAVEAYLTAKWGTP